VGVVVLGKNAEKESALEDNRTTLSKEEITESDFRANSQTTQIAHEDQSENTANTKTELPILPYDYQYE
jgi:hypothetical protein